MISQFVCQKLRAVCRTAKLQCVFILLKVSLCHWRGFLPGATVCVLLSARMSSQLLSENIPRAFGQSILIIPGGVSNVGKRPSTPLMYDHSKKSQPLIYLKMERSGEKRSAANKTSFHLNIPTEAESTHTLPSKYTPGCVPCLMILTLGSSCVSDWQTAVWGDGADTK